MMIPSIFTLTKVAIVTGISVGFLALGYKIDWPTYVLAWLSFVIIGIGLERS